MVLFLVLFILSVSAENPFFCSSNSQCSDGNPNTIDLCMRAGQSNSGCTNLSCNPVCSSNADCDDGDTSTTDICAGIGRCTAICSHVLSATYNNGICEEYENSCTVPNDCEPCYEKFSGCGEKACIGESCRNTISLGCCGNNICETKEDFSNCSEDCKPRVLAIEILNDFSARKFFRGDTLIFSVRITADGILVNDADIVVKGFFGELKLFNDGKHNDGTGFDAIYSNEYLIPKETEKGSYNIELIVNFANAKNSVNKTLFVDPVVELNDISIPNEVFLGGEINLKFRTRKESINVPAKVLFTTKLAGTDTIFFSESLQSDEEGLVNYSYRTSFIDSAGKWILTVKAEDANGNIGIKDYEINVKNPSATSFLNLSLKSDLNKSYFRGQKIDFNLFVSDELGVGITGAEIFALISGKKVLFKDENSGVYSYSLEIPFELPEGKNTILLQAKKQSEGKFFSGSKELIFDVNSVKLDVEIISPFNRSVDIGENMLLRLRITYPDGKPAVTGNYLPIHLNGKDTNLLFVGDGFFEKNYSVKEEDMPLIKLDLNSSDLYGNSIMFNSEINVLGVSWLFYLKEYALQIAAGIILILLVFLLTFSFYFKSKTRKGVNSRKEEILAEIKSVQKQYFTDGTLDKKSYDSSMVKLETELKEINNSLKNRK
ncbi:MAG: hypothetical protein JW703_00180 [Candidatus Diapherotrites archaeon]|nr:hypothetical protein [Candidatus Diapherotrites archaeon]